MTILASFSFSSSILDTHVFQRECDVMLFADGRISDQAGANLIIDTAPKIAVQEVKVVTTDRRTLTTDVAIGYAGASALVALSVLNFSAHVLRHLVGETLPSIEQIVSFVAEALKVSITEYSNNRHQATNLRLLVGGYDQSKQEVVLRQITLKCVSGKYFTEIDVPSTSLTIASGPTDDNLYERIQNQVLSVSRDEDASCDAEDLVARQVELFVRDNSKDRPYGGQLQVCRIGAFGAQLATTKFWDKSYRSDDLPADWNHGDYRSLMLGYDVFDLRVGQCDFQPHYIYHLPDSDGTPWAKGPIKIEERPADDGDVFSRPRKGLLDIRNFSKK
ncbi:hypothetical protein [Solimicrobium silvestre]|uniref:Uncharacterized protein n=1 Tax=Solimicrobium silvestre TaxID=2099400 RepID=A0A2S9H333_9BURK|nr:hypothetical protein [Solimicrobium silvestre]PRC94394.1 hypothetical protein S2091_1015 [Solimicrobium silvestre]